MLAAIDIKIVPFGNNLLTNKPFSFNDYFQLVICPFEFVISPVWINGTLPP